MRRRRPARARSAAARSASASSIRGIARARAPGPRAARPGARRRSSPSELQRGIDVTDRVLGRDRRDGVARRELEVVDRAVARRGRAGELEVMRDVGGALARPRVAEQLLHRVGDAQVQALAPRRDEIGEQRLADLLVHEAVDDLAAAVLPFDQRGVLRLLERVEQLVLVEAGDREQELEAALRPDHRGRVVSALRTSSPTRSSRRSITRRTVRGTSVSAISTPARQRPASSKSAPRSLRWRNTSSTKNGLPSVSAYTSATSSAGGGCPARPASSCATSASDSAAEVDLGREPAPRQVLAACARARGAGPTRPAGSSRRAARQLAGDLRERGDQQQARLVGPVQILEAEHSGRRSAARSTNARTRAAGSGAPGRAGASGDSPMSS